MAVFVDTYYISNSTAIRWTFPSYGDPLFLTLVIILSLPGILLNPIVIKSRITRISNSIPALLTTCLCGVYLALGVFVSTSWTYFIVKETPYQRLDVHPATGFDQVYSFMYCSGNLYSTALLYLMAFSRYRAIADPFDAISYKEILRKVIGFGIVTAVLCLGGATATAYLSSALASKFKMLIVYSMLRTTDDTPAETRQQRRNGLKMVLVLVGGQILQFILDIADDFPTYSNPYFSITHSCLFQCFQASYTAVALVIFDKGIQSELEPLKTVHIGTLSLGNAVSPYIAGTLRRALLLHWPQQRGNFVTNAFPGCENSGKSRFDCSR
eukprot:sb/3466747/